jgi:hypothetical protein
MRKVGGREENWTSFLFMEDQVLSPCSGRVQIQIF